MLRESYHKRTTLLDPDQETESDEWLEHTLMAKDQLSVVMDCLKKLPASQQKVMQLRHFADLSIPEIANVTQYTEVNIRQLLSRARSAMKAQLALIERHEP